MKEYKIYNYGETTYGVEVFKKYIVKGKGRDNTRLDITYYARMPSKAEFIRRLLALPHFHNTPKNWVEERVSMGSGGMDTLITDDGIYIETMTHEGQRVIGKFTDDGKWVEFNPPKQAYRPWYKVEVQFMKCQGFKKDDKVKVTIEKIQEEF